MCYFRVSVSIMYVAREEITVMVGRDQCVVQLTTADTVITCIAPQRDEPVMESVIVSVQTPHYAYSHAAALQVSFGLNTYINNSVGQLEYTAGPDTAGPGTAGLDTTAIAGEFLVEWC